jgi:chloramphenicol O-acetyltransferase type A
MQSVDMQTWPRREHFRLYAAFDNPHFGMSANVDLTAFRATIRQRGHSITVAITYALTRAANSISEFRHRIRMGKVVEHAVVHPSITILLDDDLFSFCTLEYSQDFSAFAARAAEQMARVREDPTLADEPGRDDLLFMTAIPWVSFTSFMHPTHLHPADSVPRFAWGKFIEEDDRLKMPLAVQGHHALMDGLHVGRFYAEVQEYFDRPAAILGGK